MNKQETILRRDDGSRIKITVRFISADYRSPHRYSVGVELCQPRKRTFNHVFTDSYITKEEIHQAKLSFWESLKPTL